MLSSRIALSILFLVIVIGSIDIHVSRSSTSASPFRLPVRPGAMVTVTQGNDQGDHIAENGSEYAFDFIVGQSNFVVTAAQSGTVIGIKDDSTIRCDDLNEEVYPEHKQLHKCWTYANYVLLADDDRKTAALYMHLSPSADNANTPGVTMGEHVNQAQPIGLAGTTGWSTGVHLHFQVETIPSSAAQQSQSLGWWWTNSLPTTFSNPEVLAQDADGVPKTGQSFLVSGNLPVPVPTTVPMPPTQTACPSNGQGRAAVMEPMVLGKDQNIVYIDNNGASDHPVSGSLKRYDVSTGQTTDILTLPSVSFYEAQISTDGQWILLVSDRDNGVAALQMIRMDGQGLQTLYCTSAQDLSDVQWSLDQMSVAFAVIRSNGGPLPEATIFLLNTKDGQVRTLASGPGPYHDCCVSLHWLDTTNLAVMGLGGPGDLSEEDIPLLLDTSRAGVQNLEGLKSVFQPSVSTGGDFGQPCYDFASSYDQTQIYVSQCSLIRYYPVANVDVIQAGPSNISVEPVTGGPLRTIYSNQSFAIAAIQTISRTKLLFYVYNYSSHAGQGVDASQNGLWTINTDGSGLTHLTTAAVGATGYALFEISPPTWLVISRDGSMYSSSTTDSNYSNQSLFFGSLNGGAPTTFLSKHYANQDGNLAIVGWTTM